MYKRQEEDILLYRKGETMYLKTFGDFQRTRTRTLSEEEQSAFKTFIAENKIDQLADYEPAVLDGIFAQYVHCSKEGRSSFYINNPWLEISEAGEMHYELLLQFFKLLSSGTFDVHYETEKTVPGLEVLIKGEDHEIEAVWKDGDDMRVQVKEPNEPGNYKDIYHWYVSVSYTHLDVYKRQAQGSPMEFSGSGASDYVEGIANLYEFDEGATSGWVYRVNGTLVSKSAGACVLHPGDRIEWIYTLNLGKDLN